MPAAPPRSGASHPGGGFRISPFLPLADTSHPAGPVAETVMPWILPGSYCPSRRKGLESWSRVKGNSMQAAVSFHSIRHRAEMGEPGINAFLTHLAVKETMIYAHVLNRGPSGVRSPVDRF